MLEDPGLDTAQLGEPVEIDPGARLIRADLVHFQRAINLAALERITGELSEPGLERAKVLGQPESQIQIAVIHAANLPGKPVRPDRGLRGCETGHAKWQLDAPTDDTEIRSAKV